MAEINVLVKDKEVVRDWFSEVVLRSKNNPLIGFLFGDSKFLLQREKKNWLRLKVTLDPFIPKEFSYYTSLSACVLVVISVLIMDWVLIFGVIAAFLTLLILFIRSSIPYYYLFKQGLRKAGYEDKIIRGG